MFSSSLLASAIIGVFAQPIFGGLLDRFGIRRVALPAAILYSLALCSFALLSPNAYWAIFLIAAGFGACLGPISYSKAITAWFDRERGVSRSASPGKVFAAPVRSLRARPR
jgi:MFS family permease